MRARRGILILMGERETPPHAANDNIPPDERAKNALEQSREAHSSDALARDALERLNSFLKGDRSDKERER